MIADRGKAFYMTADWTHPNNTAAMNTTGPPQLLLSIIIPCFNEALVIRETLARIDRVCRSIPDMDVELICIDDGSSDDTFAILESLAHDDQRLKLIQLSRNFGHQIAVTAGLDMARGDAIVIIDADLQDPPEVIPDMIAKWKEGFDVVYAMRTERPGETYFKTGSARLFYRILRRLSDVSIPVDTGDFRLISRRVAETLATMPERDRYVRGMISWIGFKQTALPYKRSQRLAGESKYTLLRLIQLAMDGILSFSTKPLQISIALGLASAGLAIFGIFYALIMRLFTNIWVQGWTALIIAVLFMGGIQLITIGILGGYVGRTYMETKRRPLYIVNAYKGFDDMDIMKRK
jgi:dolichol-phosphate mannosyltransferase